MFKLSLLSIYLSIIHDHEASGVPTWPAASIIAISFMHACMHACMHAGTRTYVRLRGNWMAHTCTYLSRSITDRSITHDNPGLGATFSEYRRAFIFRFCFFFLILLEKYLFVSKMTFILLNRPPPFTPHHGSSVPCHLSWRCRTHNTTTSASCHICNHLTTKRSSRWEERRQELECGQGLLTTFIYIFPQQKINK